MGCRPGAGRRGGRTPPDWLARPPPRTRSRERRGGPPRKRRQGRRRPGRACGRTRPRRAHPPSGLRARRRARGAHGRRPRCGRGNGRDGSPPWRRGSRRARQLQGFSGKLLSFPDIPGKSAAEFPCVPAGSRRHGSLLLPGPGGRVNPRGRIGTRACSSWEAPQAPPDAALGEEGTRRKNGIGLQTKASWAGSTAAPETQGSQTGMEIRRLPAFRHRGHKGKAKEKGDSSLRRGDAGEGKTLGQTKGALRSSLCTLCLCGEKRFE